MASVKVDSVGAAAVELARTAAQDAAGHVPVGEHVGVAAEGERVVVHRFATTDMAYRGWEWTVVVARVSRARVATVSEVLLLPGEGALLAPAWVPWAQRIAPGDLGETDLLPFREDDPLLDPGFEQVGGADAAAGEEAFDDLDRNLMTELGYGRARVLNRDGRDEAAARWFRGEAGPDTATTRAAGASCATCGYLIGMTGSLRTMFGVCANAWSPDDGRAVSFEHGCGAHSETGAEESRDGQLSDPLIDQLREDLDTEPFPATGPAANLTPDATGGSTGPP